MLFYGAMHMLYSWVYVGVSPFFVSVYCVFTIVNVMSYVLSFVDGVVW
jgi:hypothetical protein